MALAFYFSPTSPMSRQVYDECIKRLQKAGAAHPAGRLYHACFGPADSVSVFDIWTSRAAFDKFGQTLIPILEALGTNPGQPMVADVHNVIVPPARPAAKKRPAPRRAAPKSKGPARKGKKR